MTEQTKQTITAGPWTVDAEPTLRSCLVISGPNNEVVALVERTHDEDDQADPEQAANATLIAAAPELLDDLDDLAQLLDEIADDLNNVGLDQRAETCTDKASWLRHRAARLRGEGQ